jgi:branched-chain amino acid transport system substrate-binding protein
MMKFGMLADSRKPHLEEATMSPCEPGSVSRRRLLGGAYSTTVVLAAPSIVRALGQGVVKIGLIQSMTGPLNTIGKAVVDGARLYMQQHGDTVAGRKIQLIVKDDATSPEIAKRVAQETIVNEKVAILGVGVTPSALAIASLATEAKMPTIVMVSAASIAVDRSP